jgi:hypothetical protein
MSGEVGRKTRARIVETGAQLRLWSEDSDDAVINSHCNVTTDHEAGEMEHKEPRLRTPDTTNGNGGFRDSAFKKNKELPLHRWVPWIAGFSADFVDDCLRGYLSPGSEDGERWVLDPFAGVGTTLVQAFRQRLNVVGFEINPYAALAARVKLESAVISACALEKRILKYAAFMRHARANGARPVSQPPAGFTGRTRLYSPRVEKQVLFSLDFINAIDDAAIRDLFRAAFGSVMIGFSNYSYEPSLGRRASVGKKDITDADVGRTISDKLNAMLQDIRALQAEIAGAPKTPQFRIINDSIFSAEKILGRTGFVDVVVTSPPYLNNYHYPRNTRPQLHWLGFTTLRGYEGAGESKSFGKFWQTVRELPDVKLSFAFPELEATIATIRARNADRGSYGGAGWANYVATYFNDTYSFCKALSRLLKPDGVAVIVLGNSIIQGVEVKTDCFFGKIGELCGLTFAENMLLREKRTGTSIIQSSVRVEQAAHKTVLYETGVVLRKPKVIP